MRTINLTMPEKFVNPIFNSTKKHRLIKGRRLAGKSESIARGILVMMLGKVNGENALCDCRNKEMFLRIIKAHGLDFALTKSGNLENKNGAFIAFAEFHKRFANDMLTNTYIIWFDDAQHTPIEVLKLSEEYAHKDCVFFYSYNSEAEPFYLSYHFKDNHDAEFTEVDYLDNPFLPQSLIIEIEHCKNTDYEKYKILYHDEENKKPTIPRGRIISEDGKEVTK